MKRVNGTVVASHMRAPGGRGATSQAVRGGRGGAGGREPLAERASRWALGGLLVLSLALVALAGDTARAQGVPFDGGAPVGGGGGGQPDPGDGSAPPMAPPSAQQCMSEYLDNVAACHAIACYRVTFLLFISWEECHEEILDPCMANAQAAYDACLSAAA